MRIANPAASVQRLTKSALGAGQLAWGASSTLAPPPVQWAVAVVTPGTDRGLLSTIDQLRAMIAGSLVLISDPNLRRAALSSRYVADLINPAVFSTVVQAGPTALRRVATIRINRP